MTGQHPDGPERSAPPLNVSIVVPAYEEAANLAPLHEEIREVLQGEGAGGWELIFVDDGSADETWDTILHLNRADPQVKGVRLSRNFGHQGALLAGLAHARGAAVITMDADLQHPPALIPVLLDRWRQGAWVVHTVRRDGNDVPHLKRWTSRWFYRAYSWLSGVHLEPGMADFRLLDRAVVDQLLRFGEYGPFLRGLIQWMGYPATRVRFVPGVRRSGATKYPLRRMLSFAWSGISSFSVVPLRLATLLGLLTSALSFAFLLYAVGTRLAGLSVMPGWASAVSILSFLFGVLFILLGVMGEYLGKVLLEVKHRPRYLVYGSVGRGVESRTLMDRASGIREAPIPGDPLPVGEPMEVAGQLRGPR